MTQALDRTYEQENGPHTMRAVSALAAVECQAESRARRFWTHVGNDLRTEGVVLDQRNRSALDLAGLDLERLILATASTRQAAASHKLVVIGNDGVATHQLHPNRHPAVAHCGQATLSVLPVLGRNMATFTVFGPGGRQVEVTQWRAGTMMQQSWRIQEAAISYEIWRGHLVAQCNWFNNFAVVDDMPNGVTMAQARRELFDIERLTNKLVIVQRRDESAPHVTTETAAGTHGAIPATAAATLAVLAHRSIQFGEILTDGIITHPTKSGNVELALPMVDEDEKGGLSIDMPSANVSLSPLEGGF